MVRSSLAVVALGLLAMFGYFWITASSDQSNTDRAKEAVARVGDTVKDQGAASLISARLKAGLGLNEARFLHVYYDDGETVVYGMAPEGVSNDRIAALAREVPGVQHVDVQVLPVPASLSPDASHTAAPEGTAPSTP